MRVLIADDSEMMLDRFQEMLSGMKQVEVIGSFHNGKNILAAMNQLKPDLAIPYNKMPGLKGVDVIREIRKEDLK